MSSSGLTRQLVREAIDYAAAISDVRRETTLPDLYRLFSIEGDGQHYRLQVVLDSIVTKLKALLPDKSGRLSDSIRIVISEFLAEILVFDRSDDQYFQIMELLFGFVDRQAERDAESVDWRAVLALVHSYHAISPTEWPDPRDRRLYPREFEHFSAVKRLRERFPSLGIQHQDGRVTLDDEAILAISREVERMVASLSGPTVIAEIISDLRQRRQYDEIMERFLLARAVGASTQKDAQVPFGFILNLAFKHIRAAPHRADREKWTNLTALATDLAAALDIQPYSAFEGLFFAPGDESRILQESARYDNIFDFRQTRVSDALFQLRTMFSWVEKKDELKALLGISVDALVQLHERVIVETRNRAVRNIGLPLPFARDDVLRWAKEARTAEPLAPAEIDAYLKLASHDPPDPNAQVASIFDIDKINVHKRPLVHLGSDIYSYFHSSIGANGLYDVVFDAVRRIYANDWSEKYGHAFEEAVRSLLSEKGFTVHYGIMGPRRAPIAEVDALVETPRGIYIFECKAKDLSPAASAGYDAAIYRDLAQTLLHGQQQAMRVELELRRAGAIILKDKNTHRELSSIELRSRFVNRVSLTLHDFAAYHDRFFAAKLINSMLGKRYQLLSGADTATERGIADLNKFLERLENTVSELRKMLGSKLDPVMLGTWFMSISHLSLILDELADPADLDEVFHVFRFGTTGIRNFYKEFSLFRPMIHRRLETKYS